MKKNRTSWSPHGAEAMVKVISYVKSNLLEDLITGEMEKAIEKELSERELEPRKIPKIKLGKVKYAGKQTILESLEKYNRPIIEEILRGKSFNEMNVMC